uniref:NTR domain-containing protein n=1 Tax=Ascaris lumbricoides TaxID=6252 RepID=A0A0M3HF20_ASCLU
MVAIRTQKIVLDADAQRVWVGRFAVKPFKRPKIVVLLALRRRPALRRYHNPALEVAPSSRRVLMQMDSLSFPQLKPCGSAFLEIRYVSDFSTTGARFCGRKANQIVSETNKVMVLYRGSSQSSFTLRYRYDPATPVETTINTEKPTQTPTHPPTLPPTRPTLTWPPTAPPTKPLTTWLPTWSPTVLPTTRPPTRPPFTPPTWPPLQGAWSEWSRCSAQCGGCGTQSRRRHITPWGTEEKETRYCNRRACSGRRCCFPFTYIRSGLCVRAISEGGVTIDPNTGTRTLPPLHTGGMEPNVTGSPHKKLIIKSTTNKRGKSAAGGQGAEEVEEFESDYRAQLLGSDSRKDPFCYYYYYYYYYDDDDDERDQANNTNTNNNINK